MGACSSTEEYEFMGSTGYLQFFLNLSVKILKLRDATGPFFQHKIGLVTTLLSHLILTLKKKKKF